MKLIEMDLKQYLDTMASSAPAPGGGSAAAFCGAQGAALAAMVAALTVGRKKYAEYEAVCLEVQAKAQALQEKLTAQIDRDTQAFILVADAFKLPRETAEEKAARSAAIQAGTLVSTQVPFETMELALETLKTAQRLLEGFNTGAASDLGVAAMNLSTCVRGAWMNVLINIGSLKDREVAEDFRIRGLGILQEAEEISAGIRAAAEALL